MKKLRLLILSLFILPLAFIACDDDEGQTIDLPAVIQDYLNTNYPDAEIEESEQEILCDGTNAYEVEIEDADDEEIELTFDMEGNLLFTETEISTGDLPDAVVNSLTANYADYSIEEAELLDMADGSQQYEVEIESGDSQLEVLITADGTVVCEEVNDDDDE